MPAATLSPQSLLDPAVLAAPDDFYRQLREQAPVWVVPGSDVVVVSSFDAVAEAVARPEDFSSNLLALLHRRPDGSPGVHPFDVGMQTLATADPPAHTTHRKAVFPELVARRMAALRDEVLAITTAHLDRALADREVEVMDALANAVPIRVVSRLIGFQDEDPDDLLAAAFESTAMLAGTMPVDELLGAMERTEAVVGWIAGQLDAALAGETADGILGVVATAIRAGELDLAEGLVIVTTLLSAGGESTTSLLGSALHLLATDPELQQRLRGEPALVTPFVEEVLRLESPFRHHLRHVTRATELQGVAVPAGATMLLLWGAANRDPAEYERADEVVLDRPTPKHHVAFGRGIHHCVGAPLARLEAEVVLTETLARTSELALDPHRPPSRVASVMVRRFDSLPLVITPA